MYYYKIVFKAMRYRHDVKKRKNRLMAYTRNVLHRNRMRRFFESWRGVSHQWFKERLDSEKDSFRADLESKILVQWQSKVDALTLYFGQLEEKIQQEQEARENLTQLYDRSLLAGYEKFNEETRELATNPLVHEVIIKRTD